jgi:hypothetical protein
LRDCPDLRKIDPEQESISKIDEPVPLTMIKVTRWLKSSSKTPTGVPAVVKLATFSEILRL